MTSDLFQRAEAIKARNKVLESVKGSGYHDDDKDHVGRPNSPQAKGLPPISEHLVPFYGEWDVRFVGPDAEAALGALGEWLANHKTADAAVFSGYTGTERKLLTELPKLLVADVDGVPSLVIRKHVWNDVLFALYSQGVGLTGAPLESPKVG